MKISDKFKLSYGLRIDVPVWESGMVNADLILVLFLYYKLPVKIYKELL
jgi:hypothetical protein